MMANPAHYAVIMAGGKGERFWPKSRLKRPKHLMPIVGDQPIFTQTLARLTTCILPQNILVITNENQKEALLTLCPQLNAEQIIAEPISRDTAAAVALALVYIKNLNPNAVFAVFPADHVIQPIASFEEDLALAFRLATDEHALVTLGIKPQKPATGYGYIQKADPILTDKKRGPAFRVKGFVEKPDFATARRYVESGNYYWNTGIFIWEVTALEEAFRRYSPPHIKLIHQLEAGLKNGIGLENLIPQSYATLEKTSIDYAIMEKVQNAITLEAHFEWDDVGEWTAIARHNPQDTRGNTIKGNAVLENASGNIILSEEGHLTALMGVDNLIVVHTDDATLICPKSKAQEVKRLIRHLEDKPEYRSLL